MEIIETRMYKQGCGFLRDLSKLNNREKNLRTNEQNLRDLW